MLDKILKEAIDVDVIDWNLPVLKAKGSIVIEGDIEAYKIKAESAVGSINTNLVTLEDFKLAKEARVYLAKLKADIKDLTATLIPETVAKVIDDGKVIISKINEVDKALDKALKNEATVQKIVFIKEFYPLIIQQENAKVSYEQFEKRALDNLALKRFDDKMEERCKADLKLLVEKVINKELEEAQSAYEKALVDKKAKYTEMLESLKSKYDGKVLDSVLEELATKFSDGINILPSLNKIDNELEKARQKSEDIARYKQAMAEAQAEKPVEKPIEKPVEKPVEAPKPSKVENLAKEIAPLLKNKVLKMIENLKQDGEDFTYNEILEAYSIAISLIGGKSE